MFDYSNDLCYNSFPRTFILQPEVMTRMLNQLKTAPKVVGVKQTRKAVLTGEAVAVFAARDAEKRVIAPVVDACESAGLPVTWTDTMAELGQACGIAVGAACAAIVNA